MSQFQCKCPPAERSGRGRPRPRPRWGPHAGDACGRRSKYRGRDNFLGARREPLSGHGVRTEDPASPHSLDSGKVPFPPRLFPPSSSEGKAAWSAVPTAVRATLG